MNNMIKEAQFLSSTHNNHSMGFIKKRKTRTTEAMVDDIDMKEEVEIDSGDKVSQHSVQEVVTGVKARDCGCPQFEIEMQISYVSGNCQMHIPMGFAKLHLPSFSTDIAVHNMKGKKWMMHLNFTPRERRHMFTRGWKAFAIDNSLKMGDCCKFELVGTNEMLCRVYRSRGQKRSLGPRTRSRGQTIYEERSKRKKNEQKLAPKVPNASRSVTKRKSPRNASDQTKSVDSLLRSVGLDKYLDIFHAEEIDIAALKLMTEEDLKLLEGPRKKIIDALKSSA